MSTVERLRTAIREANLVDMEEALQNGSPPNHEYLEWPLLVDEDEDVFMTPLMLVLSHLLSAREEVFVAAWERDPEEVLEVLVRFGGKLEERDKRVMRQLVRGKFDDLCGFSSSACVDVYSDYRERLNEAVAKVEVLINQKILNDLGPKPSGRAGNWDNGL